MNLDGLPMGELSNEIVQEYFNDPHNDCPEPEIEDCDCCVCLRETEGYCEQTGYTCTRYAIYLNAHELADLYLRKFLLEQDAIWEKATGNSPKGYGIRGATYDSIYGRYSNKEKKQMMLAYESEAPNYPSFNKLRSCHKDFRTYSQMACDAYPKGGFTEEEKIFAVNQWIARRGVDMVMFKDFYV